MVGPAAYCSAVHRTRAAAVEDIRWRKRRSIAVEVLLQICRSRNYFESGTGLVDVADYGVAGQTVEHFRFVAGDVVQIVGGIVDHGKYFEAVRVEHYARRALCPGRQTHPAHRLLGDELDIVALALTLRKVHVHEVDCVVERGHVVLQAGVDFDQPIDHRKTNWRSYLFLHREEVLGIDCEAKGLFHLLLQLSCEIGRFVFQNAVA